MLRVFLLCAERLHTPDDDISDAYCQVIYEGRECERETMRPTEKREREM